MRSSYYGLTNFDIVEELLSNVMLEELGLSGGFGLGSAIVYANWSFAKVQFESLNHGWTRINTNEKLNRKTEVLWSCSCTVNLFDEFKIDLFKIT